MPPLVAIGDSFTQGFKSLATTECNLSFPALLAQALGVEKEFKTPDFAPFGGFPLNLEMFLRKTGKQPFLLSIFSLLTGIGPLGHWIRQNKRYWESLEARKNTDSPPIPHNLAMYGFSVLDGERYMNSQYCYEVIDSKAPQPADIGQFLKPSYSWYRGTARTLNPTWNPSLDTKTQIELAQLLSATEPIEDLIFCLGANNILGAVMNIGQDPIYRTITDLNRKPEERKANAWRPAEFRTQYKEAFEGLKKINFKQLYVGNVPRLSILPFLRGQTLSGPNQPDADGYFEYYYLCSVHDQDFAKNPRKFPAFTKAQVKEIDGTINEYNQIIQESIDEFNASGGDCRLVNLHDLLDSIAYRRNNKVQSYEFPANFHTAWMQIPALKSRTKPNPLKPGESMPIFDTRFYTFDPKSTDPEKRFEGGVFSLDGTHPTTTMAGVIAYWYLQAMGKEELATVEWWKSLMEQDSLLMDPPAALEKLMKTLRDFQSLHIFRLARDLFT